MPLVEAEKSGPMQQVTTSPPERDIVKRMAVLKAICNDCDDDVLISLNDRYRLPHESPLDSIQALIAFHPRR